MDITRSHAVLICFAAGTLLIAFAGSPGQRAAAQTPAPAPAQTPASNGVSLAERYHEDFLIGVAVDFTEANPLTPEELGIIKTHFNVVTPENSMKPSSVHPAEDRWNWETADTLVKFSEE